MYLQTLPHLSKSLAVRYSLLSWSQFVRSSVRLPRELAGGFEGCIPRNPQPTPSQPPGNPLGSATRWRSSPDVDPLRCKAATGIKISQLDRVMDTFPAEGNGKTREPHPENRNEKAVYFCKFNSFYIYFKLIHKMLNS